MQKNLTKIDLIVKLIIVRREKLSALKSENTQIGETK